MTISAIDPIVADVMLVTKGDRLGAGNTDFGDVGRLVDGRQRSYQCDQQDSSPKNTDSRYCIGAGMKYLGHANSHETRQVRTVDCPGNRSAK